MLLWVREAHLENHLVRDDVPTLFLPFKFERPQLKGKTSWTLFHLKTELV